MEKIILFGDYAGKMTHFLTKITEIVDVFV